MKDAERESARAVWADAAKAVGLAFVKFTENLTVAWDTLARRTDSHTQLVRENETLRAKLAAAEALADDRTRHAYVAEKSRGYSVTHYGNPLVLVSDLRAALATTGEGE